MNLIIKKMFYKSEIKTSKTNKLKQLKKKIIKNNFQKKFALTLIL